MDPLHRLEQTTRELNDYMHTRHQSAFGKYPLLFSLLGTFGVVITLHGFDGVIVKIPFLHDNPGISFIAGILLLVFTGSLYKRIEKKLD